MEAPKGMDQWGIQPGACEGGQDRTQGYASQLGGTFVLFRVMDRKSHESVPEITKILQEERTWQGNDSPITQPLNSSCTLSPVSAAPKKSPVIAAAKLPQDPPGSWGLNFHSLQKEDVVNTLAL